MEIQSNDSDSDFEKRSFKEIKVNTPATTKKKKIESPQTKAKKKRKLSRKLEDDRLLNEAIRESNVERIVGASVTPSPSSTGELDQSPNSSESLSSKEPHSSLRIPPGSTAKLSKNSATSSLTVRPLSFASSPSNRFSGNSMEESNFSPETSKRSDQSRSENDTDLLNAIKVREKDRKRQNKLENMLSVEHEEIEVQKTKEHITTAKTKELIGYANNVYTEFFATLNREPDYPPSIDSIQLFGTSLLEAGYAYKTVKDTFVPGVLAKSRELKPKETDEMDTGSYRKSLRLLKKGWLAKYQNPENNKKEAINEEEVMVLINHLNNQLAEIDCDSQSVDFRVAKKKYLLLVKKVLILLLNHTGLLPSSLHALKLSEIDMSFVRQEFSDLAFGDNSTEDLDNSDDESDEENEDKNENHDFQVLLTVTTEKGRRNRQPRPLNVGISPKYVLSAGMALIDLFTFIDIGVVEGENFRWKLSDEELSTRYLFSFFDDKTGITDKQLSLNSVKSYVDKTVEKTGLNSRNTSSRSFRKGYVTRTLVVSTVANDGVLGEGQINQVAQRAGFARNSKALEVYIGDSYRLASNATQLVTGQAKAVVSQPTTVKLVKHKTASDMNSAQLKEYNNHPEVKEFKIVAEWIKSNSLVDQFGKKLVKNKGDSIRRRIKSQILQRENDQKHGNSKERKYVLKTEFLSKRDMTKEVVQKYFDAKVTTGWRLESSRMLSEVEIREKLKEILNVAENKNTARNYAWVDQVYRQYLKERGIAESETTAIYPPSDKMFESFLESMRHIYSWNTVEYCFGIGLVANSYKYNAKEADSKFTSKWYKWYNSFLIGMKRKLPDLAPLKKVGFDNEYICKIVNCIIKELEDSEDLKQRFKLLRTRVEFVLFYLSGMGPDTMGHIRLSDIDLNLVAVDLESDCIELEKAIEEADSDEFTVEDVQVILRVTKEKGRIERKPRPIFFGESNDPRLSPGKALVDFLRFLKAVEITEDGALKWIMSDEERKLRPLITSYKDRSSQLQPNSISAHIRVYSESHGFKKGDYSARSGRIGCAISSLATSMKQNNGILADGVLFAVHQLTNLSSRQRSFDHYAAAAYHRLSTAEALLGTGNVVNEIPQIDPINSLTPEQILELRESEEYLDAQAIVTQTRDLDHRLQSKDAKEVYQRAKNDLQLVWSRLRRNKIDNLRADAFQKLKK